MIDITLMMHHSVVGCDPEELVEGINMATPIEMGHSFLQGRVTYEGISEGSTANYTASEGYYISDDSSSVRTCQNGSWSGLVPTYVKG